MSQQELLDFLAAFGEEFCSALSPPVDFDMICPQDAYEVWLRAFGQPPSPAALATLSELQLASVRDECERYFEYAGLRVEQIRLAVARTLARWPE